MQTEADVATEPREATPVAALPYHLDAEDEWSLEVRLIILATVVAAALGIMTFGTSLWIHLQPTRFQTVGGFQSLGTFEFALSAMKVLADVAVIAGGAAFFARRRVCRPLLIGGSIGLIVCGAAAFGYYTFNQSRSGADLVVWALWRSAWMFSAVVLPALVLVVMTRPQAKARFRPRTDD